jgi:Tfp pilus assembly PilM family ATPase
LLPLTGVLNVLKLKAPGAQRVIGIELGTLTSRAVHLQRSGGQLKILKFSVRESPLKQPDLSPAVLAEHFQKLAKDLQCTTKDLVVTLGMEDAILQRVQMPRAPVEELRQMLKFSGTKYFPQDISKHSFDLVTVPRANAGAVEPPRLRSQADVLVAGARTDLVELVKKAARLAGLRLMQVSLSMIGLADAFRVANIAQPGKPIVLGKLGFTYASVTFLLDGIPVLTRILDIDGEQLSKGLSEAYNVPRHIEADYRIEYIRSRLKQVFSRLAADFRSAMDFFESEYEQKVSAGFMFGELVVSKLALETLQELDVPCGEFEAAKLAALDASPEELTWFSQEFPQLVTAIGSAGAWLTKNRVPLNLIAEEIEERERRRRDPVRKIAIAACLFICVLLGWAAQLRVRLWVVDSELHRDQTERQKWERMRKEVSVTKGFVAEARRTLSALQEHSTNRFLFAPALNALQQATLDEIQLTRLVLQESVANVDAKKPVTEKGITIPRKPGYSTEKISLTLQAKNFGGPQDREKFIEKVASQPYFKTQLRRAEPVVLRNYLSRQVDPVDPTKSFNLFTLECLYPDRIVGYD